jgi:hypothetical protein
METRRLALLEDMQEQRRVWPIALDSVLVLRQRAAVMGLSMMLKLAMLALTMGCPAIAVQEAAHLYRLQLSAELPQENAMLLRRARARMLCVLLTCSSRCQQFARQLLQMLRTTAMGLEIVSAIQAQNPAQIILVMMGWIIIATE